MDEALKTMVLDVADNTYIFALNKFFTGYMRSSTKYTTNYLIDICRLITIKDIEMNKNPFNNTCTHQSGSMSSSISLMKKYDTPARGTCSSLCHKLYKWHITLYAHL